MSIIAAIIIANLNISRLDSASHDSQSSRPHRRSHTPMPAALRLLFESPAVGGNRIGTLDRAMDEHLPAIGRTWHVARAFHRRRAAGAAGFDRTHGGGARSRTLHQPDYFGSWPR